MRDQTRCRDRARGGRRYLRVAELRKSGPQESHALGGHAQRRESRNTQNVCGREPLPDGLRVRRSSNFWRRRERGRVRQLHTEVLKLGKQTTSPFSILPKVKNAKVTYMQYMEDTFATGSTFRSGGSWKFQSDPEGGEVQV